MSGLIERFQGEENADRLRQAILRQVLVQEDDTIADPWLAAGVLRELVPGEVLIKQGDWDDDFYLILAGEFDILVNGQPKAVRAAGTHLGELTSLNSARPRSATVKAKAAALVLVIPQAAAMAAVDGNAEFWKREAIVNAEKLEERNKQGGRVNEIPRIFVISSSESLPVAEEIYKILDSNEINIQTWDRGTFGVSDYPISSLMDAIEASDFTISVVRADDVIISRGEQRNVPRDNVNLEYGISLGVLGRSRSVLLVCAGDDVKLASDLTGLTTYRFRNSTKEEMKRTVRKACLDLKEHIELEGPFLGRRATA
jgi:CRP/FNR family transcriptional regulator, cyclic AMP receptor protein